MKRVRPLLPSRGLHHLAPHAVDPCCADGQPGHTEQQHHDASACWHVGCTLEHPAGGPYEVWDGLPREDQARLDAWAVQAGLEPRPWAPAWAYDPEPNERWLPWWWPFGRRIRSS